MEIEGGGAELKPQLRGVVPVGSLSRIDCTASLPQQMTVTPIWVLSLFSVDLIEIEGSGSRSCAVLCRLVCLRSILLLSHLLNSWQWQTQHFSQLFVNWSLDEPNSFGWMGDYNHKCAHLCQSAINLNWVLVRPLEQLISTLALPVLWKLWKPPQVWSRYNGLFEEIARKQGHPLELFIFSKILNQHTLVK